MDQANSAYLLPTPIVDSDHEAIVAYAEDTVKDTGPDPVAKAVQLYYAVRDEIWYDPYLPFYRPEHYRASNVLEKGRAFCVGKATLLCALGRASGIPSRVGFADVRNHLATRQLIEFLGSDLFVYHGFTEFYLNGKWCKATPAFNSQLCERHKVIPLEFDGCQDSIFQSFNAENKLFMEYVADHGAYAEVPVDKIVAAWKKEYGQHRIKQWIAGYENSDGESGRYFSGEEVVMNAEVGMRKSERGA
jgi:transglutaminase-like putative cysteine protease